MSKSSFNGYKSYGAGDAAQGGVSKLNTASIKKGDTMSKVYVCSACGYEYDPAVGDPENGIKPGTPFEELPEDWTCPLCGLGKEVFEEKAE